MRTFDGYLLIHIPIAKKNFFGLSDSMRELGATREAGNSMPLVDHKYVHE